MVSRNSRCCQKIYMGFWGLSLQIFRTLIHHCSLLSTGYDFWKMSHYFFLNQLLCTDIYYFCVYKATNSCRTLRTRILKISLYYLGIIFIGWIIWSWCRYVNFNYLHTPHSLFAFFFSFKKQSFWLPPIFKQNHIDRNADITLSCAPAEDRFV